MANASVFIWVARRWNLVLTPRQASFLSVFCASVSGRFLIFWFISASPPGPFTCLPLHVFGPISGHSCPRTSLQPHSLHRCRPLPPSRAVREATSLPPGPTFSPLRPDTRPFWRSQSPQQHSSHLPPPPPPTSPRLGTRVPINLPTF